MSAVYLDPTGCARYYEDDRTGLLAPENARGLTRVQLPAHVDRVWPCDIAEVEEAARHWRESVDGFRWTEAGHYYLDFLAQALGSTAVAGEET